MVEIKLVYFVPVEGKAATRFGAAQFLGCRVDRETGKVVWDLETPVGIGEKEHARYRREYASAVRRGDLQSVSAEPLPGGGFRVVVLPGSPAPGPKNRLRATGESWIVGVPAGAAAAPPLPASAPAVDAAAPDGSESEKPTGRGARR